MRNRIISLICTLSMGIAWSLAAASQAASNAAPAAQSQSAPAKKQSPPPGSPPKPFHVPQQEKFTLPNGIQITLVPYGAIPKVQIGLSVRAGNLNEAENQVWLADLTTSLMKEGTTSRSAQQVAQEAASMGGSVDVSVGPDITRIDGDVLSVRIESADEVDLRRIQDVIGTDLARLGAREGLEVTWRDLGSPAAQ